MNQRGKRNVGALLRYMYGPVRGYDLRWIDYCSLRVSRPLADTIRSLKYAIIEAINKADPRVFYLLTVYHQLLSIMAMCHDNLARKMKGSDPYDLLYDPEVEKMIDMIARW